MSNQKSAFISFVSNISIRYKIIVPGIVIVLLNAAVYGGVVIPRLYSDAMNAKKLVVKNEVDTVIAILDMFYKRQLDGRMTQEEAQTAAADTVRHLRFGDDSQDYFWINDFEPKMIMHPINTKLEGSDLTNYEDPAGTKMFVAFVEVCKTQGAGFVDYMWPHPNDATKPVPKISYVRSFDGWGWIVGTGIYTDDALVSFRQQTYKIVILLAVITLVSLWLLHFASRLITISIQSIHKSIEAGDLKSGVAVMANDEIGALIKVYNESMAGVVSFMRSVKNTSIQMAASSEQMSKSTITFSDNAQGQASSAEEVSASVEEIAAGMDQVAENVSNQTRSIDGLTQEMQSLSSMVANMELQVKDTLDRSVAMSNAAMAGEKSLNLMNSRMVSIGDSSTEVTKIVQMIKEISERINLLSLNASIEAARAGEAGRGFAVVAEEVSKLADQTAMRIKDIDELVRANDGEIKTGLELVITTVDELKKIIYDVNSIKEMMTKVADLVSQQSDRYRKIGKDAELVKHKSSEIRSATMEQKSAASEIVKSITLINQLTQANASGAEEMAAAAEEIASMAEDVKEKVDSFNI